MPTYNKLVRDRIPQIIEESGSSPRTRILSDDEYGQHLQIKLREETEEYFSAATSQEALEEMADMLEVMRALAVRHGASWGQLEAIRAKKAEARGGFEERVYLIDVQ
ncbi:nucleoside triphosphate pyrophosphohydrolase [Gorillibacterium timonense]|uniref:nucleoside triphosphate pyrophosphohydrolase n=1 Tax=Gorillibacterium timonense TaxID=1689269 RepID=UPI00071E507B|nr:nucleoside triphosphate pyrophosphohydrolase [Gorillibacterium timonense]